MATPVSTSGAGRAAGVLAYGDHCVLLAAGELSPLVITRGGDVNGVFGYYRHADIVGRPPGSRVSVPAAAAAALVLARARAAPLW